MLRQDELYTYLRVQSCVFAVGIIRYGRFSIVAKSVYYSNVTIE